MTHIKNYNSIEYLIKTKKFVFNQPYLMGIINVTPDSFSDGGIHFDRKVAVRAALKMIDKGADIIDIGGESSRPGSDPVSEDEEIRRIIPVIEDILEMNPEAIISVDTYKSNVADKALKSGAAIINDITGGRLDPIILNVIAEHNATYIIMHSRSIPKDMQAYTNYDNLIGEIKISLDQRLEIAKSNNIKQIIIDPGIGFAKTADQNFEILKRLQEFTSFEYPILIGLSRKSFIGTSLNLATDQRDFPTSILETIAILNGARIIRTHNVNNFSTVKKIYTKIYK
ncbi:MAG: dihydropteroate synthase [Ignavibacteriaceae bacterium]